MPYRPPTVTDVMITELIVATPHDTVTRARAEMKLSDIRHLPIVDERGHLCGIVSDRDLYQTFLTGGAPGLTQLSDIMTRDVMVVSTQSPLREVTALLLDHKIGAAPVVSQQGKLLGLITATDIVRFAHRLLGGDLMAAAK